MGPVLGWIRNHTFLVFGQNLSVSFARKDKLACQSISNINMTELLLTICRGLFQLRIYRLCSRSLSLARSLGPRNLVTRISFSIRLGSGFHP